MSVFSKSWITYVSACFVLVLAAAANLAQTSVNQSQYDPDKTLRSSARINPSTLAMELSIPLPSYPGRAGASIPNSINYSSKVWSNLGPYKDSTWSDIMAKYAAGSWAGWNSSMDVPQLDTTVQAFTETGGSWQYDPTLDPGSDFNIVYLKRMHIIMPDGSTHELRADDGAHEYGTAVNPGWDVSDADFYSGTFLSVDGTRMKLEFHLDGGVYHSILYMPDGSRYVDLPQWNTDHASGGTTFFDVHGNKMTYNCSGPPAACSWTDTMGRPLPNPFPRAQSSAQPSAGTESTTYPTMSSGTHTAQNVTYTWASLDTQQSSLSYVVQIFCSGAYTTNIPTGAPHLFTSTTSFPATRTCPLTSSTFDPVVLTALTLPNGAKYSFHYNVYGEIDQINYPTGGYERFAYAQAPPIASTSNSNYDQFNRIVTDRYISADGTSGSEVHWHYAVNKETTSTSNGPYHVWTIAPDSTCTEVLQHDQYSQASYTYGFGFENVGTPYETRQWGSCSADMYGTYTGSTLWRRTLSSLTETGPLTIGGVTPVGAYRDIRPDKEVEMTFEPGSSTNALITMKEHVYDTSGCSDPGYFCALNEKQTKIHNYVVQSASTATSATISTASSWFSSSTVAAINESDFLYDSNYKARNVVGLVTESRAKDAALSTKAKTQFSYDETSYLTSSSGSMPTAAANSWENPDGSTYWTQFSYAVALAQGRPTTVKRYYDVGNSYYISTHSFPDQYGNVLVSRDGRGNDTSVAFDSSYAFAYPTSVTTPVPDSGGTYGSSTAFVTDTTYDYNTGLKVQTDDPNGLRTTYDYADDLLRPTAVTPRNSSNTQVGAETVMIYGSPTSGVYTDSQRYVRTKTQIDSTYWRDSYVWTDGLGRTIRTQKVDTAGDDFVMTCYDSMGRVSKNTNPFRGYSSQTCSTTTGLDWTSTSYDALGRATSVTTPDSAHVDTAYSLADSGSQIGTAITVTDQASKVRRSVTNVLGQLLRVDEPTTSGLGSISSPNQATYYSYGLPNNLTGVTQGSQTRSFTYDNISRLTQAVNPESGTVNYTYDANSNLYQKSDARSITTTYTYDTLNRVVTRSYSNSDPTTATYYYDNLTNAKGKLIKVSNSNSTTEYTSFDLLGRVTAHKQTTNGGYSGGYTTAYTYNLGGDLLEETYPSGRMVRNTIGTDGSLSQVETKTTGSYAARAGSFVYTEAGAIKSLQLGNGKYENTVYNSRLQPTQINLGTTSTDTSLLHLVYTYETAGYHDNNGNVLSQTITVPGVSYPFVQNYTYDELNRIASAVETYNGSQNRKQEFSYDRYGNRSFVTGTGHTDTLASCSPTTMCNPTFDSSTNRINSSGYSFDLSGNMTADSGGRSFSYDAESKQTQVSSGGSTLGQYYYDGDGKRVKKTASSPTDNTVFVYDASERLVGEYSTSSPSASSPTTEYVYAGSRLLSTETTGPITTYLTADHLGTPRINTDGSGSVVARHDYMPFGEEIATSQRTSTVGYSGDPVRKKFTGYELDGETGLEFAEARMYNDRVGRFSTVDPLLGSSRIDAPHTWNHYEYVSNNPLSYSDPTGLYQWDNNSAGGTASNDELERRSKDKSISKKLRNLAKHQLQFREKFRAALDRVDAVASDLTNTLNSAQRSEINSTLDAYGSENDGNGVVVGEAGANQRDTGLTVFENNDTINVSFKGDLSGDSMAVVVAHEGKHVRNAQEWMQGGESKGGSTDLNHYQNEQRAWNVSSYVAQGMNLKSYAPRGGGPEYNVWQRSWREVDRDHNRAAGFETIARYMNKSAAGSDTFSNEHKHKL